MTLGFMTTAWSGLATGCIYALVAMAYNVGLTTSGVLNFAQAQLVGVSLFSVYILVVPLHLPILVGAAGTIIVATGLAVVLEEVTIRPVPPARIQPMALITTIGAALVISSLIGHLAGTVAFSVPVLQHQNAPLSLLGGLVTPANLLPIFVAVVVAALLAAMSTRTFFGLAGQATAEDREAAALRGVNYRRTVVLSFALGGAIAAVAGISSVATTYAAAGIADGYVVKAFVCLALFGFGSHVGALAGGVVIGTVEAFTGLYLGPQFHNLAILALLLTILMLRPGGVFSAERGARLI